MRRDQRSDGVRKTALVRGLLFSTILISGLAAPAQAQQALFEQEDGNGVDVVAGTTRIAGPSISVGDKSTTKLTADVIFSGSGLELDLVPVMVSAIAVYPTPQSSTVYWRGQVDTFIDTAPLAASAPIFVSQKKDGPTLTCATDTAVCTYKTEDGIEVDFVQNLQPYPGRKPFVIRFPDGERIDFKSYSSTQALATSSSLGPRYSFLGIESNLGFGIGLTLAPSFFGEQDLWGRYLWDSIFTYNRTVDNCSTTNCNFVQTPPALTKTTNRNITDPNGGLWQWTTPPDSGEFGLTSIRTPGNTGMDAMSFATNASGQQLVTRGGQTWTYTFNKNTAANPVTGTTTVLDPMGGTTVYTHSGGRVTSVKDPLNRITTYGYDTSYRLTSVTAPEGNVTQYTYDTRGNITSTTQLPKPGSPLPAITTIASYPASCTSAVTCNKPIYTRDAKGNQTDYTYDATTGQVTSVTAPAATTGGVRPQVRYSYTGLQAYIKNGGSAIVATGQPVKKLTGISSCQTTASCTGVLDEVKATIGYGPQTAGTANNLLPVTQTVASGTASVTATTMVSYDAVGNITAVDGALSGTADTTTMRYDAGRRVVGIISPDPDGAGVRKPTAQRITYNGDGDVTLSETGTVDGATNANWTAYASSEQVTNEYDIRGNIVKQSQKVGDTTYGVTQTSYDALGRVDCTVRRMDPAQWSSQTAACTPQTTGANGPDRVTKTSYDSANQVTKVQTAVGTADVSDEVTNTYTLNGQVQTTKDAMNNLTTYNYDGLDRLSQTKYPVTTVGANASSTTDYEQLTYDPNSNVTQRRLRDGQIHNLTYDNLNRLTLKDVPNIVPHEYDISYQYDLLGRMTQALDSNTHFSNFSYDAFGRKIAEQSNWTTRSSQYDAAGRRTRLTWGDGFYVTYDYDMTGNVTAIRENGATTGSGVLATYAYDDYGRRTSLTRGNGTVTNYSYDGVSRMTGFTHDLTGTVQDLGVTGFTYNPANQILGYTRSNDSYAWKGHYNASRTYGTNGLNQLTSAGATALGYDGRGNLTQSGSSTYSYTSENRLATAPGGYVMTYDPVGRFHWIANGPLTWMQYDGTNLIEERNAGVVRRYVHGPGEDQPLVWYEGAGLTDKRYLMTDERGSVVAVTNSTGAAIGINSYDEYGIPASTNVGRFGYTGQTWIPEIGMNYYKARMYSPTLGRFMQTDPIGYGDGLNWYNYVGSDPVNKTDPTGNGAGGCENAGGCGPNVGSFDGPPIDVFAHRYITSSVSGGSFISGGFGAAPNPSGFGLGLGLGLDALNGTTNNATKPKAKPAPAKGKDDDAKCRIIRGNSARTSGFLPGRITDTSVWSHRGWLTAYQHEYRCTSREWTASGRIIGVAGVIGGAFTSGVTTAIVAGSAGLAAGEGISSRSANFDARVDAIQDRIDVLDSGC